MKDSARSATVTTVVVALLAAEDRLMKTVVPTRRGHSLSSEAMTTKTITRMTMMLMMIMRIVAHSGRRVKE